MSAARWINVGRTLTWVGLLLAGACFIAVIIEAFAGCPQEVMRDTAIGIAVGIAFLCIAGAILATTKDTPFNSGR